MGIVIILISLWLNITSSSTNKLNNQYETYQANVIGMVCSSCQVKVEQQVGSLENIISVSANHLTGDISIVYNPINKEKTIKEINKQIDSLGYTFKKEDSKLEVLDYKFKNIGE